MATGSDMYRIQQRGGMGSYVGSAGSGIGENQLQQGNVAGAGSGIPGQQPSQGAGQIPPHDPQRQAAGLQAGGGTQQPAQNPAQQMPRSGGGQTLPEPGIRQQMNSLNDLYQQVAGVDQIGYNVRDQQFNQAQRGGAGMEGLSVGGGGTGQRGATSLDQLAKNLAQQYGLPIGRGRLVDESGNFLTTPQQMADASGGEMTLGEAAATMNAVARGVSNRQNEEQQSKGMAALETGMGQVQSRGRGSLATMMGGYYRDIADMYSNQEYEAADFSYYIQKEQLDIQQELQRRAEKQAEKNARFGMIGGVLMGAAGVMTGNPMLAAGGFGQAFGSAGSTGWFG